MHLMDLLPVTTEAQLALSRADQAIGLITVHVVSPNMDHVNRISAHINHQCGSIWNPPQLDRPSTVHL